MNHASFQSLLVPVLPATGRPKHFGFRRRARVHRFFEQVGHHISVLRGNGITQIEAETRKWSRSEVLDREGMNRALLTMPPLKAV